MVEEEVEEVEEEVETRVVNAKEAVVFRVADNAVDCTRTAAAAAAAEAAAVA